MLPTNPEIIFEVGEDEIDGGSSASALTFGIHTQAETIKETRDDTCQAVEYLFDEAPSRPKIDGQSLTCRRGPAIVSARPDQG